MLATDTLTVEARRRSPHTRARALVGELVVDCVGEAGDRGRRPQRDGIALSPAEMPQKNPDETRECPERLPKRLDTLVVEDGDGHDVEIGELLGEPVDGAGS